ncbi:4-carboxy-4-hydroxy-2-oxoadipate aldolase/oxaloacetate decarboxylase [Thermus oshimai]|uniref:4-carboxy-4-hydroxy-2-oxoadipate aldolase/oxaloacetate decarboxylase n=1 Tax=Thermus oshimai TaxID=56957 RepID=UPI00036D95B5|nr:4-carboxy-4-hydroxy-2-oxoadipate aldolase/oxaloacetate decarboxylase [Thermus oshimai]
MSLKREELVLLAELGSATVYEAAGRAGLLEGPWLRLVPGSRAAGPARTVLCAPGDNLMVHAAMAVLQPGEVLVLALPTPEPVALLGELLATQAQARGAAAILVEAAVRDADEIAALGLPVWARWVSPRGAERKTPGRLGIPVRVGGVAVAQGDYLVLDGDGVVAVPRERAREVLEKARARAEREAALRERYRRGELSIDLYGLRPLVEEELRKADGA